MNSCVKNIEPILLNNIHSIFMDKHVQNGNKTSVIQDNWIWLGPTSTNVVPHECALGMSQELWILAILWLFKLKSQPYNEFFAIKRIVVPLRLEPTLSQHHAVVLGYLKTMLLCLLFFWRQKQFWKSRNLALKKQQQTKRDAFTNKA